MNRFRANLHPALFDNDARETRETFNEKVDKEKKEVLDLQEQIINSEIEVSSMISTIQEEEKKKYSSNEFRAQDKKRFLDRIQGPKESKGSEEKNIKIWSDNISKGIGHLLTQLAETGYFDGIDKKDKTKKEKEINKVKELYYEEVKNQFLTFVRYANDKTYKSYRKDLFDYKTPNSPASKVYKKLTNAESLVDDEGTRMAVDAYSTIKIDSNDKPGNIETNAKEKRIFLSRTLPVALWNLKPQFGDSTFVNKIPILNLFVRIGNYSESQNDREAIADFIDIASKIKVEKGKPEIELLKVFAEMKLTSGKSEYEQALRIHGIDLNGVKINDVMEAGKYYVRTQTSELGKQHAIYLGILQVIKDSGSIDNAVKQFMPVIEASKKQAKESGKDYKKGKETVLSPDLKSFAEKLGIKDFTNITRLADLVKDDNYIKNQPVEQILANLNNDRLIAASDWQKGGNKSGQQFLEIYSKLDDSAKESALDNLLERAKKESKIYGLEKEFSDITDLETAIKEDKNVKLIFLLQNIIANPGGDLHTLLTGENGESIDLGELEQESKDRAKALEFVKEQLSEEEYNELIKNIKKDEGAEITSFASLQSSMAACLYDNYKLGVGASTSISFDQWVKGVKLEGGAQVRGKDKGVIGINISYDKTLIQKNGWTLKGQLGGGVTIPIVSGKIEDPIGTANTAFSLDKKIGNKKTGTAWHVGADTGVAVNTSGNISIYGGLHGFIDKTENLEEAANNHKKRMEREIEGILKNRNVLNISDNSLRSSIKTRVSGVEGVKKDDVENVTNGIMRILISFDGLDVSNEATKQAIASRVAEQYRLMRMERSKEEKSKHYYFGGAAVGAFLTLGTPRWGIYVDLRLLQKHYEDGRVDVATRVQERRDVQQEISNSGDAGERTEDRIQALNQRLSLENGGLEFENELVKIPESLVSRGMIKIGDDMKGKMYKDKAGNLYLSAWTPIHEEVSMGTGTLGRLLHVGNGKNEILLNNRVDKGRYADSEEGLNENMIIETNKRVYTVENAKSAINAMLKTEKGKKLLSDFDISANNEKIEALGTDLQKLAKNPNKVKIVIERNKDGFDIRAEDSGHEGSGFEIDYQVKLEMFNEKARDIANRVYTQVSQIEDATILNSVKHEKGRYYNQFKEDYNAFIKAMGLYNGETPKYDEAKRYIKNIFATLDELYISGTGFQSIGNLLDDLSDEDLGQALLSINNIFARSTKVEGNESNDNETREYDFTTSMRNIIAEREGEISGTIKDKFDNKGIADPGYKALIADMRNHRTDKANIKTFNVDHASAYTRLNTVGFNLGDFKNPENPLFNPEIYDIDVDLDFSAHENLMKHVMSKFATNETLFHNIKKAFGAEGQVKIKDFIRNGNNGTLTLDIGGKIVTLSADMKVGYFTQCVNHTVILENIQAESNGLKVNYNSVTGGADRISETSGGISFGTWNVNLHLAGTIGKEGENQNSEKATDIVVDGGEMPYTDDGDTGDQNGPDKNDNPGDNPNRPRRE